MRNAVVSAENRSFWTDPGLDPKGIVRAAWSNVSSDSTQGASTITQQYVKILYLSQERTWTRKIKEAFISVKIDQELSKQQILEGYLNTIYFGRGAYGVDAAAEAYFQKPARFLTVPESAVLAAVLNSPSNFDPAVSKANRAPLLARYRYVLNGMGEMGNLRPAEVAHYQQQLPAIADPSTRDQYAGQRGYLMSMVLDALKEQGMTDEQIYGDGLKIISTFSFHDMQAAQKAVYDVRPKGKLQLHVGLASVEPATGAVRAIIGGRNYLSSQLNWATNRVQPGSTFKAFAVAAALSDGYTLNDTFNGNSPFTLPDGTEVHNEGEAAGIPNGQSYGTISLQYATEQSVNTAFVDLTTQMENGPRRIIAAAEAAGIPSDSPGLNAFPNVALGTASVSPLSMADAYATFATNGNRHDWYVIQSVTSPGGPVYEHRLDPDASVQPSRGEQRDRSPARRGGVRHRTERARLGATGGRQDGHGHSGVLRHLRGARVVVLVRRLHAAAGDRRRLHPRGRQRPARRLPRHLLRRRLPHQDLDGVHGCRPAGSARPRTSPARRAERHGADPDVRAAHAHDPDAHDSHAHDSDDPHHTDHADHPHDTHHADDSDDTHHADDADDSDDADADDAHEHRAHQPQGDQDGAHRAGAARPAGCHEARLGRVVFPEPTRTTHDVVAPTLADPLARAASPAVSGPLGRHARTGRSWWTVLSVTLLIGSFVFALGVTQKSPCVVTSWSDDASPKPFSHLCYTDIPLLYVSRGLAEGIFPYTPVEDLPADEAAVRQHRARTS